jgi:hypothetical protein
VASSQPFTDAAGGSRSILKDPVIQVILVAAFLLRFYAAATTVYIWDEDREWIPVAQTISFAPGAIHLPVRTLNHGALSAYFIKLGTLVFGDNQIGFRALSLLFGTATILLTARIARTWAGQTAARWAAALVAFNEYHAMISMLAISKVFALAFAAWAADVFVRAIRDDRPRLLPVVAVAVALAILSYEIMYLLIPAFAAVVLVSKRYAWLRSPYLYLAALLGLIVLLPDLLWNLLYSQAGEVTYLSHLERSGGIGFNKHYLLFFFRDAIADVYRVFEWTLHDDLSEYVTMNALFGSLLFGATVIWTWRFTRRPSSREDSVLLTLLALFWVVFLVFTLMAPGTSDRLDNRAWLWVDLTLIPAAVFAGALIGEPTNKWRHAMSVVAAAAALYAVAHIGAARFGLQRYAVEIVQHDSSPAEGEMVEYRAVLHACHVCDKTPRGILTDIQLLGNDGTMKSAFGTPDVADADRGSSDFAFRLRVAAHRPYVVTYRIWDGSGEREIPVRIPAGPAPPWRPPPFWAVPR